MEDMMETLSKAPESPQDARKACGCHPCTTEQEECSTVEVKGVADDSYYAPAKRAKDALDDLAGAYAAAYAMLIGLRAENKTLREQVAELMVESRELSELKAKLRGMVQ